MSSSPHIVQLSQFDTYPGHVINAQLVSETPAILHGLSIAPGAGLIASTRQLVPWYFVLENGHTIPLLGKAL